MGIIFYRCIRLDSFAVFWNQWEHMKKAVLYARVSSDLQKKERTALEGLLLAPAKVRRPNPTADAQAWPLELVFMLRVFGRLPVSDVTRCSEAGVRKASGEETAGGVCAGSGVGLWRFSLSMPRSLDFERGSRLSNRRGVGFGRRVQDRTGGLVVSDLRFGGRRRD